MKKRYSIGFFVAFFVFSIVLVLAFQWSYNRTIDENNNQIEEKFVLTEGSAEKKDGYVICEKDGFVIVYLSDQKTVYEYTTIEVKYLPEKQQEELKTGIWASDLSEVYGFLENYSS